METATPYRFEGPRLPPAYLVVPRRRSLGATGIQTGESIAAAGVSTTTGILSTLSALSATTLSLSAITMGIGAAVAGAIALSVAIYNAFKGCGQTCIQASNIANQVEQILRQNLNDYLALPVHYASLQAAHLNNFQTAWQALVQACSAQALQQAGVNCIQDRQQGACHYHTSPGGWQNGQYVAPGQDGSGSACWNWFVGYRDPIANDPTVVPDPALGADGTLSISTPTGSTSLMPLLLIAAVIAGVMLL
jgi:hypothetical protein